MNATDSWGAPSVDEAFSTDITVAGVIDSVSGNHIQDAALLASYKDHQLSSKGKSEKYYLRALDGTDAGVTWLIKDNVGDYIILDTTAAHSMATSDTFAIFQSYISDTFTGGVYRFIRIDIDAQQTADDYYQIGTMIVGVTTTLTRAWAPGYGLDHTYDISLVDSGIAIKNYDRRRLFDLKWSASQTTRDEVISIADYTETRPFALIPDSTALTTCYLVHLTSGIPSTHRSINRFDFGLKLREVI